MSLGNSFILGLFLTIIFYTVLIMIPSSIELLQSLKKLFFGSHVIYYLIMIVFFWVIAILIDEYTTAQHNRKLIVEIKGFFETQDMYTLRHSELLELQISFEKKFSPVTHSAITYKVSYLLKHLKLDQSNADTLMERLAEIEFQAQEYSQGFLHTLLWSLPLLGFMGTILGIIDTVGTFSEVLGNGKNAESLIGSLGGLSLAFETTLLGLISSLIATYLFAIIRRVNDQNSVTLSQLYEDELINKLAK
jgi:biopolymer transport protein ExbB/TolQ